MDILPIYNRLFFLMRKYRGSFITEDEISDVLDMGSKAHFNTQIQDTVKTGLVNTSLNPFRTLFDFTATNFTSEYLNLPANHVYTTLLQVRLWDNELQKGSYKDVKIYKNNQWGEAINSQVNEKNVSNPAAQEVNKTQIEFYPVQSYRGRLRYLRMPAVPKIVFVYTTGQPVYDQNASVQLEWPDTEIDTIIFKGLSLIGINLTAADLTAYAEMKLDKSLNTANKE